MNFAVDRHDEHTRADAGASIASDAYVLPERITAGHPQRGPRFGDDRWDLRPFVPRTEPNARIDFTTLADPIAVVTVKEYLYSRLRRAVPIGQLSSQSTKPMKLTRLVAEFTTVRLLLAELASAGASRLSQVTHEHFEAVMAGCADRPHRAKALARVIKHLAGHGPFLSADRLEVHPWLGRPDSAVATTAPAHENLTERIPEHVIGPLLKAAVFYVETASHDIVAARDEIARLQAARVHHVRGSGQAKQAVEAFIAARRKARRGIPALPIDKLHKCPSAAVVDGVVQAPDMNMVALLAGMVDGSYWRHLLVEAGQELGYEEGGLDMVLAPWPDSGAPWRQGLGMFQAREEMFHLRTACWSTIAYLSGMRSGEIRELGRDCAFTEPGDDGRIRYKLRGRVFKDRDLRGEEAEWVVLEIVHQAVAVLLQINDDPTHLFGYTSGRKHALMSAVPKRLASFQDHCNKLFSGPHGLFIPDAHPSGGGDHQAELEGDGASANNEEDTSVGVPWAFNARQFRRTLAWHIAHQPFGIVAGAKQYKHAAIAMFEGYAGTSASGFAAEVASEEATALLDYAEELYRDWNDGGRSAGGATAAIDGEFDRIRRELGDLPGTVASPARLRTMLEHLNKTLHPGILSDCFYRHETAVCAKRASSKGRPLPMLNMCCSCPNARRSTIHLPRLSLARDQAHHALQQAENHALPPLQRAALTGHAEQLDALIAQLIGNGDAQAT